MEASMIAVSSDEQMNQGSNIEERINNRYSLDKIARLDEIFQTLQRPHINQIFEIAEELDLEIKQVHNWFSNKRKKVQIENDKEVNVVLRAEKERILEENMKLKVAQKNVFCESCKNSHFLKLQVENELLKEKIEMVSKLMEKEELSLELKLSPPTSLSLELKLGHPTSS